MGETCDIYAIELPEICTANLYNHTSCWLRFPSCTPQNLHEAFEYSIFLLTVTNVPNTTTKLICLAEAPANEITTVWSQVVTDLMTHTWRLCSAKQCDTSLMKFCTYECTHILLFIMFHPTGNRLLPLESE